MTRKPSGRRKINAARQKNRVGGTRQRKKELFTTKKESRYLFQFVICSGIFVFVVAVKLLLPAQLIPLQERVTDVLGKNMNVQEVFSAVAQAVNGECDVEETMSDVYQAVFRPQEAALPHKTVMVAYNDALFTDDFAIDRLREFRKEKTFAQGEATPEMHEGETVSAWYNVLYSDENMPDNASMEQAILGFDYCEPVLGTLSSPFGYREHPTNGSERFHYGIDIAAEQGREIRCFANGTVKAVGESSSYGKYLIVSHQNGYDTLYAHCSKISVPAGKEVSQGDVIAEVGETGMATGPHLHFELLKDSVYLNPIYYVDCT